jgi:hypothetical protein
MPPMPHWAIFVVGMYLMAVDRTDIETGRLLSAVVTMGVRHYFCLPARPEASAKSVVQKKLIDSQTFHTTGAAEAL